MRKRNKTLATLMAAVMVMASGTLYASANNIGGTNGGTAPNPHTGSKGPVHNADASKLPSKLMDVGKIDYAKASKAEKEAYSKKRTAKYDAVMKEARPLFQAAGLEDDLIDGLSYGGEINIPVGKTVEIHFAQSGYALNVAEATGVPGDEISSDNISYDKIQTDMLYWPVWALPEELITVDSADPALVHYDVFVDCMPLKLTGLKDGAGYVFFATTGVEPQFYKVVVGTGKKAG